MTIWDTYQVAGPFATVVESEESLERRNDAYLGLHDLMPTSGFSGKTVLDYGCGPGHDTLMFARDGAQVIAADISARALLITKERLSLHELGPYVTRLQVTDPPGRLPPVDHIHCAGVLHHTSYPLLILKAFADALNPGGEVRLSCYDGTENPGGFDTGEGQTVWWTRDQVCEIAADAGFDCEYLGTYPLPMACYRLTL